MINEGLVEADGQNEDRRLKLLRLTAEGQRVHDALDDNFDTWADRLLATSALRTSQPYPKDSSRSPTSSTPTVNTY